ncbi:MAG: hypothetical protein KF833_04580 [Verrucomicrobiae bacterium]|nr:hypothetical protein [Verrucomicrobiae bacterium]
MMRLRLGVGMLLTSGGTLASTESVGLMESPPFRVSQMAVELSGAPMVTLTPHRITSVVYGNRVTNVVFDNESPVQEGTAAGIGVAFWGDPRAGSPPARPQPRYVIDRWNVEGGLPAHRILSLLQTRDGFLWMGKVRALVRFDGVRFTTFDAGNTPELRDHRSIGRCLYEDPEGRLWIGTGNGVLCRAGGQFVRFPGDMELQGEAINAIAGRAAGGFWIGADRGLGLWEGDGVQWMEIPGVSRVLSLAEAADGRVWLGTPGSVTYYDTASRQVLRAWTHSDLRTRAAPIDVLGLLLDRRQRLWIASTHGIALLNSPDASPVRLDIREVRTSIGLAEDGQGNIWATNGSDYVDHLGSLFRLVEEQGRILPVPVGPMMGIKLCIWVDRDGAVWAGGWDGLARVRALPFAVLSFDGPSTRGHFSLAEDPAGALWLGGLYFFGRWSGQELAILDTQRLFNVRTRLLQYPLVLAGSSDGTWASHSSGGLFRLPLQSPESEPGDPFPRRFQELGELRALHASRSGGLWLGTSNRLFLAADATRAVPMGDFEFPGIHAFIEDRRTNLWIGTQGGLYRLDPTGRIEGLTEPFDRGDTAVIALHATEEGELWLGTRQGLQRFAMGEFARFGPESGLPQLAIHGILEDDSGRLWMSCDAGVVRVALDELRLWLREPARQPAVAIFGTADGVATLRGRVGAQTCIKGSDGRLWFSKDGSLVVVDPSECPTAPPPQVHIESAIADGEILNLAPFHSVADRLPRPEAARGAEAAIDLRSGQGRHLEFRFTATSLHSPERVLLRYRLDGHDPDWIEAGSVRRASYANLRPGRYRFRVQARNHEGRWSEDDAVVAFRLTPFLWESRPFYLTCGLGLFGGTAAAVIWRLRRQRRRLDAERRHALETERARIARDLHDHLGSRLTAAAFTGGTGVEHHVRESLGELGDLIWAVHPEHDTLPSLAGFIIDHASRFLGAAGLTLKADIPPDLPDVPVAVHLRRDVAGMFKEALRNVVQHAHATHVSIRLRVREGLLELSIEDNGCGFDGEPGVPSSGQSFVRGRGLRNLRTRCAELGGHCEIRSRPGCGVEVRLVVPMSLPNPKAFGSR